MVQLAADWRGDKLSGRGCARRWPCWPQTRRGYGNVGRGRAEDVVLLAVDARGM